MEPETDYSKVPQNCAENDSLTTGPGAVSDNCPSPSALNDGELSAPETCSEDPPMDDNEEEIMESDPGPVEEKSPQDLARQKRQFVIMELVETEEKYVEDLGILVEDYMEKISNMELPENFVGKERIVFANIQQIYEFHKTTFQPEIAQCINDYQKCPAAFVKYERRLHMYVVYCQNKPKSEFLVSENETFFTELRTKLGHKLSLPDLLIKPVQRIMKYQLLLKDILKYTQRAEEDCDLLHKAMHVMHVVPKACDDMMHVGRLQGFNGKITAQGKLLLQGTISVSENPPNQVFKGKDRQIFLFEQSLMIADYIKPKNEFSNPNYIYKSHILVNKMGLTVDVPNEPLRIILKNKDPASNQEFLVQLETEESKNEWVTRIKGLLDTQMDFLRALQAPIAYQKEITKTDDNVSLPGGRESARKKSPIINRIATKVRSTTSSGSCSAAGAGKGLNLSKDSLPANGENADHNSDNKSKKNSVASAGSHSAPGSASVANNSSPHSPRAPYLGRILIQGSGWRLPGARLLRKMSSKKDGACGGRGRGRSPAGAVSSEPVTPVPQSGDNADPPPTPDPKSPSSSSSRAKLFNGFKSLKNDSKPTNRF